MHAYLACFDITDDHLRRKLSRRLAHFGVRVQRSVFEISLQTEEELAALKREIAAWVEEEDNEDDDVRFYAMCRACRKKACNHQGEAVASYPAAVIL